MELLPKDGLELNRTYQGDNRDLIKALPDESVARA